MLSAGQKVKVTGEAWHNKSTAYINRAGVVRYQMTVKTTEGHAVYAVVIEDEAGYKYFDEMNIKIMEDVK